MNAHLIHDQTLTGCSGSIMGCTTKETKKTKNLVLRPAPTLHTLVAAPSHIGFRISGSAGLCLLFPPRPSPRDLSLPRP